MQQARHFALVATALILVGGARAQEVHFDGNDPTPVVRYQEIIPALADDDPGPTVEVFGDGRVRVHFPRYMRRAGTYEMRLPPERLERLLADLLADGIADFDADRVQTVRGEAEVERESARRRSAGDPEVHSRTDPTTTVIETRLTARRARQSRAPHVVRWTGLRGDAEMFPEVPALAGLAAAEQRLRSLLEHPDLLPVP